MTLHIMKLSVGSESVSGVQDWHVRQTQARRRAGLDPRPVCDTRNTPKQRAEVLNGGSLYWVIKGVVLVRQPILDLVTINDGGQSRCEIVLDQIYVLTAPQPRRAFQGWRYLDPKDAPPDIAAIGEGGSDLPEALKRELITLGAW